MAADSAQFLARVWEQEAPGSDGPNFERIVRDAKNNLRDALTRLESELLAA
jgi:hypothetical protein